ncbi:MAG: hypothetical protein Q9160_005196 [Pyrenula sp. 1 TL-2023]
MPVFTTTSKLSHRFPLPPTGSFPSAAVAILHDHDWAIRLDPELDTYTLATNNIEKGEMLRTKTYNVVDHMGGIPKSIHDAKVNMEIQITDVDEGVDFLIHAPMGVVQRAQWRVTDDAEKPGEWQLVAETEITCSRLLMGIIKGKADADAPLMGQSLIEIMKKDPEGRERGDSSSSAS